MFFDLKICPSYNIKQTTMFRAFVRAVKVRNTEDEIKQMMTVAYPTIVTNSTVRTLEKICTENIKTAPDTVLVEMLKMLNTVVPKISKDATIQSVYLQIRKAIKELW